MHDCAGVRKYGTEQVIVTIVDSFYCSDPASSSCSFHTSVAARNDAENTACTSFASTASEISRSTLQTILRCCMQDSVLHDRAARC